MYEIFAYLTKDLSIPNTWVVAGRLDLQLPVQSVPITTKVRLNPVHGEVYSIEHYVIKFVSDLRTVSGFLLYSGFPHQ